MDKRGDKKGMEMWQLVLMILALLLLVSLLIWYGGLGGMIEDLFNKLTGMV
jgi:hypothetical protein